MCDRKAGKTRVKYAFPILLQQDGILMGIKDLIVKSIFLSCKQYISSFIQRSLEDCAGGINIFADMTDILKYKLSEKEVGNLCREAW